MTGYIYKLTSPSGKNYVGQKIDLDRRFKEYQRINSRKGQRKLINSIKKHGWDNFIKEVLFEGDCTISFLNTIEIYYIDKFNCCNPVSGLNLQLGGLNGFHSEETKKLMSESAKKIMVGDYAKRRNAHWKGRKHSLSARKKMSIYHSNRTMSREWIENIRQSVIRRGGKIVLDTQLGIYYASAREASDCYPNIAYSTFKGMLNGAKKNRTSCIYV